MLEGLRANCTREEHQEGSTRSIWNPFGDPFGCPFEEGAPRRKYQEAFSIKYVVDTSLRDVSNQVCRGHLLERPSKHHEGPLGAPWGTPWETLGTPWRALGAPWGTPWETSGTPWRALGPPWGNPLGTWGSLGVPWGDRGDALEGHGDTLGAQTKNTTLAGGNSRKNFHFGSFHFFKGG